jgi:hypothetical protein
VSDIKPQHFRVAVMFVGVRTSLTPTYTVLIKNRLTFKARENFTISCVLMLIYYRYLSRRTRRLPNSSVYAVNTMIRERWGMIMSDRKLEILAIQTVRNSVMAASSMATTAMLLIII